MGLSAQSLSNPLVSSIRVNPTAPHDRSIWLPKLEPIDPDAARAVRGCGTYGAPRLVLGTKGKNWITGGLCKRQWDCPTCAAIHARQSSKQLSDLVRYLTTQEGLQPDQFLFATLGMRATIGSTRDRAEAMNKALTKLVNQRWFKNQVLGYEMAWDFAGSLTDPDHPWINAHLHGLWITRPGVELEDFKHQVYDYLKGQLGDLIGWDEAPALWRKWLQPAKLSPAMGQYVHGHVWRGSHEVGATFMKHDKQRGSYQNHFDRHPEDLAEIQPLIRAQLVRTRRGGIVPKVRKLLSLQDEIHQDVTKGEVLPLPPQYRHASHDTRRLFRQLVEAPGTPPSLVRKLVTVPAHVSPEEWEAFVLERAGGQQATA